MAEVTKLGVLDCQVCVPKDWTDEQVVDFVNQKNPSGLANGWIIRKEGDKLLKGDPERRQCEEHTDNVHIMLDC
jgi:hypothetical protein